MLSSLRFRLPALFLVAIVLSGLVATLIAIRFFQSYTHARAVDELRGESAGIVELYATRAGRNVVPIDQLQRAIGGDEVFFAPVAPGLSLFAGKIQTLPPSTVNLSDLASPGASFEFTRGDDRYLAYGRQIHIGDTLWGAIVVGKKTSTLRSGWLTLVGRLALALVGGVAVAGLLVLYFSRRITRPLRTLSRAADEVAAGHYGVEVPEARGGDEIAHLSDRFREMALRLAESEALTRNFLMSVSHELRTPLTAIRGHVAAIREGVIDDPESQAASLEVIATEATRLERLVGDVLDLAKLDAHRFTVLQEEVDMEVLCDQAYTAFAEQARQRDIDYRREFGAQPVIVTDGDRVLQIISNLLSNAFRWTPPGGRIELSLSAPDGVVAVDVADSGPGITAEERERIFRPFWSRDGGGTGLGLAIAHELASALGGRIELDSEPGRGSRFRLVLPHS